MRTPITQLRIAAIAVTTGLGCIGSANAQVGIGTTTPNSTLNVVGNSTAPGFSFGTSLFYNAIFSQPTRLNTAANEISYGVLSHTNANATGTYNAVAGRVLRTGNANAANLTGAIGHVNQATNPLAPGGFNNFQTALLGITNSRADENGNGQVFSGLRITSDIDTATLNATQKANTYAIFSTSSSPSRVSGRLGLGTVTAPTHQLHVGATADPLRLDGLQAGTSTDGLLSVDANGVVRRVPISTTGAITDAGNGLTKTGNTISLGGTLTNDVNIAAGNSSVNITGASIGDPAGDAVLSVTNTPVGALTSGTSAFAAENLMNYNGGGAGLIQIPQIVGGLRSRTISNSQTFQAQGGNFEARATGGGGGDFHAIGSISQGTSTVATVTPRSTLVGLQAAAGYFGPSLTHNWDVIGVDAFTFYGRVSSERTAGGNFDGNGGVTSFGLIGTIDDNPYTTFNSSVLTGKRIGVVASNRVGTQLGGISPGVADFALYGIGDVRFTEGDVVVGEVNATTGFDDAVSAVLQANSTTQGFLPPRMTESQANAIFNKAEGLMVYITNADVAGGPINGKGWYGWNGTAFEKLNP